MKLANHYKLAPLAERITMLMEAKFDGGEGAVDPEMPPPRQPPPQQRAKPKEPSAVPPPPTAAAPAANAGRDDADADDEAEEAMDDEADADTTENAPPQAARPPVNPFAKATGDATKSVLEVGTAAPSTGPLGAKRKAVAPPAGKKAKKAA